MTLSAPPRPLTSRVRWRATTEPRVRGWWIVSGGILIIAIYFCAGQVIAWQRTNRLLTEGMAVEAVVESAGGIKRPGSRFEPDTDLTLAYKVNDVDHLVAGRLPGRTEKIVVGNIVTIHVDKADPTQWTGLTRPSSLGAALVAGWTLLPLVLLGIAGGLWARARLLKLYRDGHEWAGTVEEVRHTALAPGSNLVRCSLNDPRDARLYTVYVPRNPAKAPLAPGDPIDVLHHNASKAAAVGWFE